MSTLTVTHTAPAPLVYATAKGVTRTANTEAAQARAPSKIRTAIADDATLRALTTGQYGPFLRDVRSACSQAHAAHLAATVAAALSTAVDGVPMVPHGDVLAVSNKRAARAVAQWLQNPTTERTVKGVTTREAKPLPKGKQYLCAIAGAWLTAMDAANMGAESAPEAHIPEVTSQDAASMDETMPS